MKRTGFDTMSPWYYPFYISIHPKDGFQELRANKKSSVSVTVVIVLLWLFSEVFYRSATSYDMNNFLQNQLSIFRTAMVTVLMYVIVCVSNWCFCTLMEGKGRMIDICTVAAYALLPYTILRILTTVFSWVLAGDEQIFLTYTMSVVTIWCLIIAFIGLAEIHEYTYSKTFWSVILTIVGLIIILFIVLMLLTLFQQVYMFMRTVIMELIY